MLYIRDPMMMVMMLMIMVFMVMMMARTLLLAIDENRDMGTCYAALHRWLPHHRDSWQAQGIELSYESILIRQKLKERRSEHITGSTHAAVYIKRLHLSPSFLAIWFIMLARYPAPNPLSIFTTDTPLAHELSIERSAASPENEAP